MFVPIRTDRRLHRTPWVNLTLIGINVAVFLLTKDSLHRESVARFFLDPVDPHLYQFITYQFLHETWMHIAGNMVFLYVFGNSVEDRLGKVGYLAFYLAGGVIAGLGHSLIESSPVLGASGAIAGVTGAYLALFPASNITIAYWFIVIGTFEVSGMVLILFQIAENIVMQVISPSGIAYLAHLFGYGFGFVVGMTLLGTRVLAREPYDLLAMIEQWRRRSQFRAMARKGYRPWDFNKPGDPPAATRDGVAAVPVTSQQQAVLDLRSQVLAALGEHDLDHGAPLYERLLELDPGQVMGRQQQLDLANQLMSQRRYPTAARAYELFLNTYRADPQREQVELMLGLLYARYLDRRQRAKELLTSALSRLHDTEQRGLAEQVLGEIG